MIGSELVREEDGLAMSSRNVRLSPQDREQVGLGPILTQFILIVLYFQYVDFYKQVQYWVPFI